MQLAELAMILLLITESVGKVYSDVVDLSKSPSIPLFVKEGLGEIRKLESTVLEGNERVRVSFDALAKKEYDG